MVRILSHLKVMHARSHVRLSPSMTFWAISDTPPCISLMCDSPIPAPNLVEYGLEHGCPPNFEKEKDRLTFMEIVAKRYSFLFEDAWFIAIQYFYFEKFLLVNGVENSNLVHSAEMVNDRFGETVGIIFLVVVLLFNMIFTAIVGLFGLTAQIPYCFKMIKEGRSKRKIFFILTFIQIFPQTILPFLRIIVFVYGMGVRLFTLERCTLVGFQVYSFRIEALSFTQMVLKLTYKPLKLRRFNDLNIWCASASKRVGTMT